MENERIKGILKEREFQDKKKEAAQKYEPLKLQKLELYLYTLCNLKIIWV